ncbi:glycosyltransferase family 4 protein [Arcobacter sp. CECT 8985]|uniref:glycosyltransferase family 4 protein n=1 Tax=Arcobacter sp. CECT 8985 TaxID=1935424 RepID=UPI00100AA5EB|nr:glycosyltransferase family 4 protein [Arcobacter sp. CECT 8985]RXJ87165.1 glycosyl transferase [Arcobacter sp. CECT 8985]
MKNKNILEVCLSPDLGGLELYMANCSNQFSKEFNVTCIVAKISKLKDYITDIEKFELNRKSSFSILNAFKLAKIIDKKDIDIVHLHWTKDIPIIVLAKLLSKRKPKIVQTRHMNMTRFKSDFYHKFLYKNIDTIICVTKSLQEQITKFIPSNIRPNLELVYLGANEAEILTDEEINSFKNSLEVGNSFMVGLIGRINEFKGQHLLIEAMKELKQKNLNIKAYIIGSAMSEEYLEKLKQKVDLHDLNNVLKFVGFTKEPYKFMQACDVVLMTSKNETFGLVTIEAMKNQTAVIASNSGGVLEIIEDENTGLLFENQNANDLAKKIEKLYNNKNLKDKLAKAGKNKADRDFDNNMQFKKLIKVFKTIGE